MLVPVCWFYPYYCFSNITKRKKLKSKSTKTKVSTSVNTRARSVASAVKAAWTVY